LSQRISAIEAPRNKCRCQQFGQARHEAGGDNCRPHFSRRRHLQGGFMEVTFQIPDDLASRMAGQAA
jgi:hypothetical protein